MSDSHALYIHIPFCIRKCDYCDFYSSTDRALIPDFIQALLKEIDRSPSPQPLCIETVYFGGGTPSVLSPDQIHAVLNGVHKRHNFTHQAEITLEANPGTVNLEKLTDFYSLGINRLSLGIQSFDDGKLIGLSRIHTRKQAVDAIINSRRAGFENVGIDLMYGVPNESASMWQSDLDRAVSFSPAHISCYMLTVEPFTALHDRIAAGRASAPCGSDQIQLFEQTAAFLTRAGYDHYEISNFAKGKENRSRHNSAYWRHKPYLGVGPSAHSFDGRNRSWNHSDISLYVDSLLSGKDAVAETETLSSSQQMMETVMIGLRTKEGIDTLAFENRFGISFLNLFEPVIARVRDNGYGTLTSNRFVLNLKGQIRLDHIVRECVDLID